MQKVRNEVLNVTMPNVSFRADNMVYNTQAGLPGSQFQKDTYESHKKKNGNGWQIAGAIASISLAATFIVMTILGRRDSKKMMDSMKNKDVMDELTNIKLQFKDLRDSHDVEPLTSKTTNPKLRDVFMNLAKQNKLSAEAKNWSGTSEKAATIYYVYGYGGVGKTYAVEQYAQEIGALFTSVKYPDLGSPFKDAASMKINSFFDRLSEIGKANSDRPVVLCIDEGDALIKKVVENTGNAEEATKSRAAVLTGLDKISKEAPNVTIVITSNYHPESGLIDDVVKRRLNCCIEVPLPERPQADAMFKLGLSKVKALNNNFYESKDYNDFLDSIVDEGYSNGEISKICEEARKSFAATLDTVPKEDLTVEKHPFTIDYLIKGKELKGAAAWKTNTTMSVVA